MPASAVIHELPAGAEVSVIAVQGALDRAAMPQLELALDRAMDSGRRLLVIDLCDATFIDSRGVHVLLRAGAELHRRLGGLALACAEPAVVRVIELSAISPVAPCYPTRQEALDALLAHA